MALTKEQIEQLYDMTYSKQKHVVINTKRKILLVEDGSVDTEKLDLLGIDYIVYRQGSKPPYLIEIGE